MINDYKKLQVWGKAMDLVVAIYDITKNFPSDEKFGLTSQIRRAAVSMPSNIAEGKMRGGDVEFKRFLFIAFASGAELETQIDIAKRISETSKINYSKVDILLSETMKMLNSLIKKLDASS
ncbi:MAG: four helix bundle protein [Patescibacteria group bacterium]